MNHTTNKQGKSVIAIGSPGSIARAKCEGKIEEPIECAQCNEPPYIWEYPQDAFYSEFYQEVFCSLDCKDLWDDENGPFGLGA